MDKKSAKISRDILLILIFIIVGNIFIFMFKNNEKYIYYWDIAGYWTSAMNYTRLFFSDFKGALQSLYESILYNDYTLLPILAYIPVFKLFSQSNTAFVMTTYNVFGVSFMVIMYVFFVKKFEIKDMKYKVITLLSLFTFTVFLTPLMGGYLDACGLTVITAILLLMEYWDLKKIDIVKALLLSFLILILCFLRRWYSFWMVSFFIAYFTANALKHGVEGIKNKDTIKIFLNLFIAGTVWLLILILFFREFLIRVLTNNFSFAYSAYDFGGMNYNLGFIWSQTGWFFITLFIIGAVLSICDKKQRFYSVFLLLQSLICLIMFTRIQSLGVQHLYLFVPMLLYFSVYAAISLPGFIKNKYLSLTAYALIFLFICLNFFNSYYKHDNTILKAMDGIFSGKKLYKRERNDIENIDELIEYINNISGNTKYVYLLSSSPILNSDILKNAYLPDKEYATSGLLYTNDVDKRDGFPHSFYTADIVIVADPVQYHLDPDEQRIVGVIASAILSGEAEGALIQTAGFDLDDGVTARVYERIAPYSSEFINNIDMRFKEVYPEYGFLNDTVSIYSYIYDLDLEPHKNIHIKDKFSFGIDFEEKTGFKISTEDKISRLKFSHTAENQQNTGKILMIKNDKGEILFKQDLSLGVEGFDLDVSGYEYLSFELLNEGSDSELAYTEFEFEIY